MQLLKKPKKQRIKNAGNAAGNLTNAAIAGGGTGALLGLIANPAGANAGKFHRKAALAGAGIYAGASAVKGLVKSKKNKM